MFEFYRWLRDLLTAFEIPFSENEKEGIYINQLNKYIVFCENKKTPPECIKAYRVWEDLWKRNRELLSFKIISKLGLTEKIPARLCSIQRIDKHQADQFLEENHLLGTTSAKIKYGIYLSEKYYRVLQQKPETEKLLLGVLTISRPRKFRDDSISYEILRFCVLRGFALQGGFSKMFNHFIKEVNPDHVMTYADLEWYKGGFYEKFGFLPSGKLEPIKFKINSEGQRIKTHENFDVINCGSIKYTWKKKLQ